MSTILKSPYVDDLRLYAPGVDAALGDTTIKPFIAPAEKELIALVGKATYSKIMVIEQGENDILVAFKTALANLVMYRYQIWDVVQRRRTNQQDTYKYELELMESGYIDNYFSAVDSLVELLNADASFVEWQASDARKAIANLIIKSEAEFNHYYNIDNSYYYYYIAVFLQRKAMDKYASGIDLEAITEAQMRRLKSIIAQLTVAYSLRQFDFSCLPKTIRNSIAEGASRTGAGEQGAVIALSDWLFGEAEKDLSALIAEINLPEEGENIAPATADNREENKYYMMS